MRAVHGPLGRFQVRAQVTPQFGFSGPGGPSGGRREPVVTQTERAEGRPEECIAIGDRCAPFRGYRLEMRLAMLIPFLFDEPIEASEAVFQFGVQTLERLSQLLLATAVDVRAPLRFA